VGVANYAELAKGQMLGGMDGFLKIIFSPKDFKILGVHAIGEGATEIVHIGQVRGRGIGVCSISIER
jgi:NAD(P) transhydrogenase